MPLNTREGVAEAPIEPGLRTLCEPWLLGPLAKLWRLMVPAKPLPLLRPLTLIRVARLERLDRDRLADGEALGVAELDQMAVRCHAGVLQVPDLGLAELASP